MRVGASDASVAVEAMWLSQRWDAWDRHRHDRAQDRQRGTAERSGSRISGSLKWKPYGNAVFAGCGRQLVAVQRDAAPLPTGAPTRAPVHSHNCQR
jgi:hypothetical protein